MSHWMYVVGIRGVSYSLKVEQILSCTVHTKLHCELHYVSWVMLHRLWYLGVVYTMDYEVIPRPCKSVDWLLNSSHDHFGLHKENMSEWAWRSRSPKDIYQGLKNPLTQSNRFCGERGKRSGLVGKGGARAKEMMLWSNFNEIVYGGFRYNSSR